MNQPILQTGTDHSKTADTTKQAPPADAAPKPATPDTAVTEHTTPAPVKAASSSKANTIFRKAN